MPRVKELEKIAVEKNKTTEIQTAVTGETRDADGRRAVSRSGAEYLAFPKSLSLRLRLVSFAFYPCIYMRHKVISFSPYSLFNSTSRVRKI